MSKTPRKAGKILRYVFRTLLLVFLSLILGFNIYTWNAKTLLGEQLPMPFGYGAAVVLSGSMEPELSVDDLVVIKETDDIAENDVIVYQSGNSLVIHRVIEINGDEIVTKGDANNTIDDPITLSAVKGKLLFAIPFIGIITHITRSPIAVICIILLALLLMELSYSREKSKEDEQITKIKAEIQKLTSDLSDSDTLDVDSLKSDIEKLENKFKDN